MRNIIDFLVFLPYSVPYLSLDATTVFNFVFISYLLYICILKKCIVQFCF